ncbi:MAG: hypothetical protein NT003_02565 [Candidatus Magasanikbacteria bacterium]|nr:hypothetical protein [Candidatus Magasanikbacteria bacterium]
MHFLKLPLLIVMLFLVKALFETQENPPLHIIILILSMLTIIISAASYAVGEYFLHSHEKRRASDFKWFDRRWKIDTLYVFFCYLVLVWVLHQSRTLNRFEQTDVGVMTITGFSGLLVMEFTIRFLRRIDIAHNLPEKLWPKQE